MGARRSEFVFAKGVEVGTSSTAYITIVQTKRDTRVSSHGAKKSNGIAIALKNVSDCKGDGQRSGGRF